MKALPKADLTFGEIPQYVRNRGGKMVQNPDYPPDGMCKTGHLVPGARFFAVSGPALPPNFHGVYCDACVAVANRLAARNRKSLVGK